MNQQTTPVLQPSIEQKGREELVKFLSRDNAPTTPLQAWLIHWRTQYERGGMNREAAMEAVITNLPELVGRNLVPAVPPQLGPGNPVRAPGFIHVPGRQAGAKPAPTGMISVPRKQ